MSDAFHAPMNYDAWRYWRCAREAVRGDFPNAWWAFDLAVKNGVVFG